MEAVERVERAPGGTAKRWRRILRRICLALGLTLLALCILSVCVRFILNDAIEKRLDLVRKAGYPITLEEFAACYPSPPADQPAAALYQRAFEALPTGDSPPFPSFGFSRLREPTRELASAYVNRGAASLDLLHQAAQISDARIRVPLPDDVGGNNHLATVLDRAFCLLRAEGTIRADAGDMAGAVESLWAAVALANAARECTWAKGQEVTHVALGNCVSTLHRILNSGALSAEQLERSEQAIAKLDPTMTPTLLASAKLCTCNSSYRTGVQPRLDFKALSRATLGSCGAIVERFPFMELLVTKLFWLAWRFGGASQLECLLEVEDCVADLAIVDPGVRAACASSKLLSTRAKMPSWLPVLYRCTSGSFASSGGKERFSIDTQQAQRSIDFLRALLAVERYRLDHGRLPDRVEDMAEDGAVTSFWNASTGPAYTRLPEGYVVYEITPRIEQVVARAAKGEASLSEALLPPHILYADRRRCLLLVVEH